MRIPSLLEKLVSFLSFFKFCMNWIKFRGEGFDAYEVLKRYIETSSFLCILRYRYDKQEAREYMNGIFHMILLNAIVKRLKIADSNMLENVVYLKLRKIYPEVYVEQLDSDGEIHFVAIENGIRSYYQVSQTTLDEHLLNRELAPLRKFDDNYPKYLLTLNTMFGDMNYDGIQKMNAYKMDASNANI